MNKFCLAGFLLFASLARSQAATIDLRSASPQNVNPISGEWDLYQEQLLVPEDFRSDKRLPSPISFRVPGLWPKTDTYASYHADIILPKEWVGVPLTLGVRDGPGAWRIWIGEKELLRNGQVGRSLADSRPGVGQQRVTFIPGSEMIPIIMQLSSYHHREGGIWHPLEIGPADAFRRFEAMHTGLDCLIISSLLLMAIYHFSLYIMRPKTIATLSFAALCLFVAVRCFVTGIGNVYLLVMPDMSFEWQKRLEYASIYLAASAFYSFSRRVYPHEFSLWVDRCFMVFCLLMASTTLLPTRVYSNLVEIFQAGALVAVILVLIQSGIAFRNKRDGVHFFVLGATLVMLSAINDILHAHQIAPIPNFILPYGQMCMILSQALLLARRFSDAYNQIETNEIRIKDLNQELVKQNEKLAEELEVRLTIASKSAHHINNPLQALVGILQKIDASTRQIHERLNGMLPPEKDWTPSTKAVIDRFKHNFRDVGDDLRLGEQSLLRIQTIGNELRLVGGIHGRRLDRVALAELWNDLLQAIKADESLKALPLRTEYQHEARPLEAFLDSPTCLKAIIYVLREAFEEWEGDSIVELSGDSSVDRVQGLTLLTLRVRSAQGKLKGKDAKLWREVNFSRLLLKLSDIELTVQAESHDLRLTLQFKQRFQNAA